MTGRPRAQARVDRPAAPALDRGSARQVRSVIELVQAVVGDKLIGAYLHGSAVHGGLRPRSDLDLFAVVRRRLSIDERRRLVAGLLAISGSRARPPGRSIELTIVRQGAVRPWRYPPRSEFQYGDWLRDRYEAGWTPGSERMPDLAVLITIVLAGDRPLVGPPPASVLAPVPTTDLRRAAVAGIQGLLDDLPGDTTNVLLTLARIWLTVVTGAIEPKDVAADWALRQLSPRARPPLSRARAVYLGEATDDWAGAEAAARASAAGVVRRIEALDRRRDRP